MRKSFPRLMVVIAVLMGVLTFGAPAADAADITVVCSDGVLDGEQCLIEVPVSPDTCADGDIAQPDGCATPRDFDRSCPAGSQLAGESCLTDVDDIAGPAECDPSYSLVNDRCLRFADPHYEEGCDAGSLVMIEDIGAMCVLRVDPLPTMTVCDAGVFEDERGCYVESFATATCAETHVLVGERCHEREEPVYVFGCDFSDPFVTCEFEDGDCGLGPCGGIDTGECVGLGEYPDCYNQNFVSPTWTCADGDEVDQELGLCRTNIPGLTVEIDCEPGTEPHEGGCAVGEPPREIAQCVVGTLTDGRCVVDGGLAVGEPMCPADAQGAPGSCHILSDAVLGCSAGIENAAGTGCLVPSAVVPGGCPSGYDRIESICRTAIAPTWFCAGKAVTINMILGDSGIGTSGRDVILGTAGNDIIRGGAGSDIICAGDGNDTVYAGSGSDKVFAGDGDDKVRGGNGNDRIYGQGGNDNLSGNKGDDRVRGGSGNDTIDDSIGTNICAGGSGTNIVTCS